MKLHVIFGYSVLFLVLFRIFYGFVGTKYARFSDFLYPPAQIVDYLKGLLIGRPKHYVGAQPCRGIDDRNFAIEFVVPLLGVLVSSLVHRENLIKAMITGRKRLI